MDNQKKTIRWGLSEEEWSFDKLHLVPVAVIKDEIFTVKFYLMVKVVTMLVITHHD